MPSSAQPTAAPISPGMRRPEELRRIGHADEAGRGHLEDAELVRRAEAVLGRAQDAVLVVAVALELEDAVDEVLEDAWSGDRAVLRHVTDEDRRHARLLRDAEKPARRLAHLRDGSRSGAERGGVQRLHRVDDAHVGTLGLERRADRVELGLGEDLDRLGAAEPRCAKRHLRCGLLARDEQRATARSRDRPERGEQERRLPDARLAADEHERCRHEPTAEHAVELRDSGRDAIRTPRRAPTRCGTGFRATAATRSASASRAAPRRGCRRRRSPGTSRASGQRSCHIRSM